jgi:hypothetical protein
MSGSGGIRGIRQVKRKKSSLSEVKLAVLGAPGVGKSGKFFHVLLVRNLFMLNNSE